MAPNRAMTTIIGPVHELNMHAFKDAARREAMATAKRQGLESPWVVEVIVYDDDDVPCCLATVSDGTLVAWKEIPAGDLDDDDRTDAGGLTVGFSHEELERGIADGEFVILDEKDSDLGRIKIAVTAELGDAYIVEWRDPERNGHWVWIRTTTIRGDWLSTIQAAIARNARTRSMGQRVRDGGDPN